MLGDSTPRPHNIRTVLADIYCANATYTNPLLGFSPLTHIQQKTDQMAGYFIGAGEGIRTLDINLGKVALYP